MPKHLFGILFLALVVTGSAWSAENQDLAMDGKQAVVSFLSGQASVLRADANRLVPLAQGDLLFCGDRIDTGADTRLAITLPDKSQVRFGSHSSFALKSASFKKKKRDVDVRMFLGKVWAKVVRKMAGGDRFQVSTSTAVAGVRGTVYRVNVAEDETVRVKVHWGEVLVESARQALGPGQTKTPVSVAAPTPVAGPQAIAGPHKVSMEEWSYIVKSMQQIVVQPDGTVQKPFAFDLEKEKDDPWVVWNEKQDALLEKSL